MNYRLFDSSTIIVDHNKAPTSWIGNKHELLETIFNTTAQLWVIPIDLISKLEANSDNFFCSLTSQLTKLGEVSESESLFEIFLKNSAPQ